MPLGKVAEHQVEESVMASPTEFLVSSSGQMSVPASVRHRWGLDRGGPITVIDLGDAVVLLPPSARQSLLGQALSAEDHLRFVANIDDPDLATT
jgi:bifunctional DNA-binding transcriptional regulator/antitoxin component of YhaV-PrlF toxin-antitoxin module